MDPVIGRRPTAEEYRQALDYFRTGVAIDVIGERLGLDAITLERLEFDGWSADDGQPALAALRTEVLARLTRMKVGELDAVSSMVEAAAKTAPQREKTAIVAAMIENAILSTWGRKVTEAMKPKKKGDAALAVTDLCVPKDVLENLRELRRLQDPIVDRRYAEIFARLGGYRTGEDGGGDGDSWNDAIIRDLADLTPEEQQHYAMTKELPKRQQELPFPKTEAA